MSTVCGLDPKTAVCYADDARHFLTIAAGRHDPTYSNETSHRAGATLGSS